MQGIPSLHFYNNFTNIQNVYEPSLVERYIENVGRWLRKGTLEHMRTAKIQTSLRIRIIGIIAKILSRRLAVQTGLGFRHLYMSQGPFLRSYLKEFHFENGYGFM